MAKLFRPNDTSETRGPAVPSPRARGLEAYLRTLSEEASELGLHATQLAILQAVEICVAEATATPLVRSSLN